MEKLFLIFFIILLFYYFNKILSTNEYFDNQNIQKTNIYFLNKNELSNILIKDDDNYYKKFYYYDLHARHIKTIDEYKLKIKDSVVNLTENQKNKLIN